ncbi:MAG: hypothetical protein KDB40_10985 [Acidimicrobiales bacterium]|nr:hypothetical protein [Acidimicrobiales bacterium]MCB9393803.1 hypothetical protein [Acidimicrobiaceae bacterium]
MSNYTDLIDTPVTSTMGMPSGYSDYRFIVQAAFVSDSLPIGSSPGSFIIGTSPIGGVRWRDVTADWAGVQFTRGGTPGSPPIAGEATIRLRNHDRKYSPFVSPFHAPATLVRFGLGNDSEWWPMFTGLVQSWNETPRARGRANFVEIRCWETSFLLANNDDPELASPVGAGESIVDRFDRILNAADWQFDATYTVTTPTSGFALQGTTIDTDLMSELRKVTDSIDYVVRSGKDGNLDITDRAVQWLHEDYRALGTDVPVVLDSLVTQNDDVRLLADFSAGRAFGVPTTYTNSGIASRYQRRSASKTDMVTIDPGGDADMIHLAARVLGRGDVTYRPESVRLEAQSAATWEFLKRADIGDMVHIDDPTSNVRFADYSIARMSHQITPRANRGIVWSCAVEFDVEVDSMWAVTDGPAIWDETRWDKSYWS